MPGKQTGIGIELRVSVRKIWRRCRGVNSNACYLHGFLDFVLTAVCCVLLAVIAPGCRPKSEKDVNSQAKMVVGSPQWNKAAAENISVRIVAVLQRPAPQLSWTNEREMLQLTHEEKEAIEASDITGQLEVVYTTGEGSGSKEVRVVIIQSNPLMENARLPVPESGSAIYIEKKGVLKPLSTNFPASALTLEIYQEKKETTFFMDYPRDGVRSGGSVFWWDENGKWHEL